MLRIILIDFEIITMDLQIVKTEKQYKELLEWIDL